ncbi:MAG TPA: hypothetical protein VK190_04540 [Pseudoneobacillus sp.]|nr:hypothetical protein [Pseudoneobacillus sp.]
MNMEQLQEIQKQLFFELGFKVDIYHSQAYRGIIAVPAGQPLTPFNVVKIFNY